MIRLQRIGKKKQPTYRFVISEKHKDTQSGSLEILGEYNPQLKEKMLNLKKDRIKHWLTLGAQPSETVHNILVNAGVITGKKQKSVAISNKRRAKLNEKQLAQEKEKEAAKEKIKKEAEAVKAKQDAEKAAALAQEAAASEKLIEEQAPVQEEKTESEPAN